MRIESMKSGKGNAVPNQFTITTDEGTYFQSYDSTIVFISRDRTKKTQLDKTLWNFSKTTSKYRNIFLLEDTKTTKAKIDSGEYELKSLN